VCGTSVYYGITGNSVSMCILAYENMDGALHRLHACVCMAYVYVRVRAWCIHGCTYSCMCVRLYVYMCTCVCLMVLSYAACAGADLRILYLQCACLHYATTAAHVCVRVCAWHLAYVYLSLFCACNMCMCKQTHRCVHFSALKVTTNGGKLLKICL